MCYLSKTAVVSVILSLTLLAGCGDFEWFPKGGAFTNQSTATSTATKPGTVMRELLFPSFTSKDTGRPLIVSKVGDLAFDKNSNAFWLLARIGAPSTTVTTNALVSINATTGAFKSYVDDVSWPATILDGSTLAFDGTFFWITSNGSNSGVAAREVYKIFSNGFYVNNISNFYNCPATSAGFCQGLAFDPATSPATASYWSAGSDNSTLVNYSLVDSTVTSPVLYTNSLFAGASDVAFDSATNEVFVVKNGIIRVNKSSGANLGGIPFTLPGSGRGDWDGTFFWVVDNSSKSIKALFVR